MSQGLRAYIMLDDKELVTNMIKSNNDLNISKKEVQFLNENQNFEMMKILIQGKVLYQFRLKSQEPQFELS